MLTSPGSWGPHAYLPSHPKPHFLASFLPSSARTGYAVEGAGTLYVHTLVNGNDLESNAVRIFCEIGERFG